MQQSRQIMMSIYPYNYITIYNLLYRFGNGPNIIALTGNKNDGKDYIANYISHTYKYQRLDFEDSKSKYVIDNLISKFQNNQNYIIGNLDKYNQYLALSSLNPFIIKVDDTNQETNIDDEYKLIPHHLYLLNQKDKHLLIKQLKYHL